MNDLKKLKTKTKINDQYHVYYRGKTKKPGFKKVTRFTDKSIWLTSNNNVTSRESWNTFLNYINNRIYRKIKK